ncbi:hypothetical protein G7085_17285 [Tessaracoccus sp. HDW20]|uniref:GTPase n=1 Tax=Tessaracoccus coleopterorum TaxID=2714950 RepID=UPI0018D490A1|nr:GTPase [Tessaracoccus coleopterorum]NHB85745.1 hypothetical protein [Tessaracoccus coleopterorum]
MTTTVDKLDTLSEVVDLVQGRVPSEVEGEARRVLAHATRRLAAGPQTTVALAGATGSGKSSLFNAISGTLLAEQGARRPTTSRTLALSFTASNPALLDLLAVERRHEAQPPTPTSPTWCSSTSPTTTRRRVRTARRSTGWSGWWTSSSGCSTRRSTPTRPSTSATSARWPGTATSSPSC